MTTLLAAVTLSRLSLEIHPPRGPRTENCGAARARRERVFGFTKVCYRGWAKNRHRLVVACALANLFMMRKRLLRLRAA